MKIESKSQQVKEIKKKQTVVKDLSYMKIESKSQQENKISSSVTSC